MITLAPARVGPYVRALHAAVAALAPGHDHVPADEVYATLQALDPALSATLLAPAELTDAGMPAWPWIARLHAELAAPPPPADAAARAEALDPELAARFRARTALADHLGRRPVLPTTRLSAHLRRLTGATTFTVVYDRVAADGAWVRIRADLTGPAGVTALGPLAITEGGAAVVDDALRHLLTRHSATGLPALHHQLATATGARVSRLSRGTLGPFWSPAAPLPAGVPAALGQGLLLHASLELLAEDVRAETHLDPWLPAPADASPAGVRAYRDRRFAARGAALPAVRGWLQERGLGDAVVGF